MTPGIRPGQDADADAIIRLIGDCWAEYPGCVLDVDGELPELRALASWFAALGGSLWVAEAGGALVGMMGVRPRRDLAAWEICRFYVAGTARGGGLAHALLDTGEAQARAAGAEAFVLWTDTRFVRAQAFYEKRGYSRQGPIRVLDDISRSLEFCYAKPARGLVVQTLDVAAAASLGRGLSQLLISAVAAGATAGFLRPVSLARADAIWRDAAARVAQGHRVLLAAWSEGDLAGAAQLDLDGPETQPHRGAITRLLLDPSSDRMALARALLSHIETAALARGKTLLTCERPAGDAEAAAFSEAGWQEAGRIFQGDSGADGVAADSLIFWKSIG